MCTVHNIIERANKVEKKQKRAHFFCSSIVLNGNYGKNKHAHGLNGTMVGLSIEWLMEKVKYECKNLDH